MKARELCFKDIYSLSKIYRKMDIKLEVKKGVTQEEVGAQLINKGLGSIHKASKEINKFLAELCNTTSEKIENLTMTETKKLVMDILSQDDAMDFLKQAVKSAS